VICGVESCLGGESGFVKIEKLSAREVGVLCRSPVKVGNSFKENGSFVLVQLSINFF